MKRAVIYVRVSHQGQLDGTSLADQERSCRDYAQQHDLKVVRVYRDEGRSAYKDEVSARPAFRKMLNDARLGSFRVVLVYKLDRFARKARIYHNAVFELERAGVELVSVSEPTGSSSAGRLSSGMMAQFAEFYSHQLSERIRLSLASRVSRGDWIGGAAPFGYERSGRTLRPGPLALWVGIIYHAYIAGNSSTQIAQALNSTRIRLRSGQSWTRDSVLMVLHNRAYLGYGSCKGLGEYRGRHPPLITEELWTLASERLEERRRPAKAPRSKRSAEPGAYTAFCFICGAKMRVHHSGSGSSKRPYWRCSRALESECAAGGVRLDLVDSQVHILRTSGSRVGTVWLKAPRGIEKWEAPEGSKEPF